MGPLQPSRCFAHTGEPRGPGLQLPPPTLPPQRLATPVSQRCLIVHQFGLRVGGSLGHIAPVERRIEVVRQCNSTLAQAENPGWARWHRASERLDKSFLRGRAAPVPATPERAGVCKRGEGCQVRLGKSLRGPKQRDGGCGHRGPGWLPAAWLALVEA